MYCSPPSGGDQDVLASFLGNSHVVHLYIHVQSMSFGHSRFLHDGDDAYIKFLQL